MTNSVLLEQAYITLRRKMTRLAYRYLGLWADAEDLVQEAFIRLSQSEDVEDPEAWLARVVSRLAIDRLRQANRRAETYVGQWLPEPVPDLPDVAPVDRELELSYAVMRALEALSPLERAAFFLHDLFEQDFLTIGLTLHRSPVACRQLASRARRALRKVNVLRPAKPQDLARMMEAIAKAVVTDDVSPLAALLAADAELVSDGGGKVVAAPNVVHGALEVARFLRGISKKITDKQPQLVLTSANGSAAVLLRLGGRGDTLMTLDLNHDGLIRHVYIQRNPDKLTAYQ